jgi:hypothetical protein
MIQEFTVPIHIISEANTREHWRKSHARHKAQKYGIRITLLANKVPQRLPVIISMTRMSPRKLDSDNLQTAFKYVRDAIAEHFITGKAPGRADDDPRIEWKYSQVPSKEKCIHLHFEWPH